MASRPAPLTDRVEAGLRSGGKYMASHQEGSGAFGRSKYSAFRDGYAITGLGLSALWTTDEHEAYRKGTQFLLTLVTDGNVRNDINYPYYAIPLAIVTLSRDENAGHDAVRDVLIAQLRKRQLTAARGVSEDDPAHGGWAYDPYPPTEHPQPNLSATLFAIGALKLAGASSDDPALVAARRFVEHCQNVPGDGGFFFAPGIPDANKAGEHRSYGSMTADGLRALLILGYPPQGTRVAAARAWLTENFDAERNPGEFAAIAEVRRESSYYYWAWSAAHAMQRINAPPEAWAKPLAESLLQRQSSDGSWANPSSEMREDDPLVATPLAMAALAICHSALMGDFRTHARTEHKDGGGDPPAVPGG